jgi:very-short-patch-repair endonuclease
MAAERAFHDDNVARHRPLTPGPSPDPGEGYDAAMATERAFHDDNVPAARRLRKPLQPSEAALWERLRGRQLDGLKFRRQHPIGRFVVDFYCTELRLAVELDGGVHSKRDVAERDGWRQALIEQRNMRFLRIAADADPEAAAAMIASFAATLCSPSPGSGEGVGG